MARHSGLVVVDADGLVEEKRRGSSAHPRNGGGACQKEKPIGRTMARASRDTGDATAQGREEKIQKSGSEHQEEEKKEKGNGVPPRVGRRCHPPECGAGRSAAAARGGGRTPPAGRAAGSGPWCWRRRWRRRRRGVCFGRRPAGGSVLCGGTLPGARRVLLHRRLPHPFAVTRGGTRSAGGGDEISASKPAHGHHQRDPTVITSVARTARQPAASPPPHVAPNHNKKR